MTKPEKPKVPPLDNERIKDICEAVYRERLGERDTASMIAKDADGGVKLRARAQCYAPLVGPFCRALGVPMPRLAITDEEQKP